ncbi:MAG: HEAT repeat domain-containing protein [Myxococcales bacterium]|nr:HEAT repeat domain-containing protein [Myxococcales bacterium]
MIRKSVYWFAVGTLSLGLFASSPAQAGDLDDVKEQVSKGRAKAALKSIDKFMKQAVGLRVDALTQLGKVEEALRAYEVLVNMNSSEDTELLGKVVWAYSRNLLKGSDSKGQQVTAEFLGETQKKQAVQDLLPLLSSPNFLTRLKAAEALGEIGDRSAAESLRKLLSERRPLVKYHAAHALSRLRDKSGVKELKSCFKSKKGALKLMCARYLGENKDRSVLKFLREQMTANNNRRVRAQLAKALQKLRDRGWAKVMKADLTSESASSRKIAATTLGELKVRSARGAIEGLLKDSDKAVQIAAGQALGRLGRRSGGSVLAGLLKDGTALFRIDAAQALVDVKDPSTQSALEEALRDPHILVRLYAAEALLSLGYQTGAGAVRDALVRGNAEIKAIAARIGMKFAAAKRLKGRPLSPTTGELPPPKILRVDAGSSEPEDDNSAAKTEPAARTKPSERAKTVRRRPPPRRRGGDLEEDW